MYSRRFRRSVTVRISGPQIVLLGTLVLVVSGFGRPTAAAERSVNFSAILDAHTRTTFRAVADYVKGHPQAADADSAYRWLFETAEKHALEPDAIELAERYLRRKNATKAVTSLARLVHGVGLAKSGHIKEALDDFDAHIQAAGLRAANQSIDFAVLLSAQAQLAGDVQTARNIWERLSGKFLLNPYVRRYCEIKLRKLHLLGKPAPAIGGKDLSGKPIRLADYRGKVLLVDFWGTNCPPCLAAFPDMKRMYAEFHPKGLETVGISLDQNADVIGEFQKTWKLPWRLALGQSERGGNLDRYQVVTIPSSFLVDRKGNIAYVDLIGPDLRRAADKLLKAK